MAASTKAPSRWRGKAGRIAGPGALLGLLLTGSAPAAAQYSFNRWEARPVAPPAPASRPAPAAAPAATPAPVLDTLDEPQVTVEQAPVFPGGQEAFVSYVLGQLRHLKGGRPKGTAQVRFVVQPSGAVAQVQVLPGSSLSAAHQAALAQAVAAVPRFVPGQRGGQPVAMPVMVPLMLK